MKFDFSGWATRNNLRCSDGRTILKDAFKDNDGQTVPLVWNHQHNDCMNVLGHALLKNKDDGVYVYGTFNDTESGRNAKLLVEHGDISALSIFANHLRQLGNDVCHGEIKEVSLVLAGANPGAFIDSVLSHGEESEDSAIIYTGEELVLAHADKEDDEKKKEDAADKSNENAEDEAKKAKAEKETAKEKTPDKDADKPAAKESDDKKDGEKGGETVRDIFNTLSEKQKTAMYSLIADALTDKEKDESDDKEDSKGGEKSMKHNVFDQTDEKQQKDVLMHADGTAVTSEEVKAVFDDARRYGNLKDSALAHGIEQIDYLFPDAKNVTATPQFISREMSWVQKVLGSTHHTPFSRIKSIFADITEDEARAKGYIKGKLKKEEVFSLLKRTTTPTTVYKKQKMDRDDVIDIVDFDVVAWIKGEMRMMLDEELARAILIGDGRLASSDDKINESNIRPVFNDDELYTIQASVETGTTDDDKAKAFIRAAIKTRKDYKGSGQPTLYTTEDMLTDCLLLTDTTGRDLFTDVAQLAKKLRVKEIVTVPVMEGVKGKNGGDLLGLILNLADYNVGADKGGAVNMFDDFDIDYNAQKYLIETRCSGALIKPYSAIALEAKASANP